MQNIFENTRKPQINRQNMESDNGLQNLVAYYQNLFDREENYKYYSPEDYQNAKRNFVKYSLKERAL